MKSIIAVLLAMLWTAGAMAEQYRAEDHSIRCSSETDCNRLIGRRLWVTINVNSMCEAVNPLVRCRKIPVNYGMTVEGFSKGSDLVSGYLRVRGQDGAIGYVSTSNSHLLTYTDPAPSIAARRKAETEKASKEAEQRKNDVAIIAATPRETYEKACILAAAEKLPRIPGLSIRSSKVTAPPTSLSKPSPDTFTSIIEIAATAALQDVTYTFACTVGARTPAFVQLVGSR